MNTRPLVIGNWKMNLSASQSRVLAKRYVEELGTWTDQIDIVACPSAPVLKEVADIFRGSAIILGAQNAAVASYGPWTGEIAPEMLAELGVRYCIVGHSERRQKVGETDAQVHDKVQAAVAAGLIPVICVGETLEDRSANRKELVVTAQISAALEGVKAEQPIIIAYEPVWAISTSGTGLIDTGANVAMMAEVIHQSLVDRYPIEQVMQHFSILYGGSVDQNTAADLLRQTYVRGALIGGASLDPDRLRGVIETLIA